VTGVTVTSFSASLRQKISTATDSLCKNAINLIYCVHLKKGVHFQVTLKQNHVKKVLSVHTVMKTPGMTKHTQSLVGPGSIILR